MATCLVGMLWNLMRDIEPLDLSIVQKDFAPKMVDAKLNFSPKDALVSSVHLHRYKGLFHWLDALILNDKTDNQGLITLNNCILDVIVDAAKNWNLAYDIQREIYEHRVYALIRNSRWS
jgi:hypothetical protein